MDMDLTTRRDKESLGYLLMQVSFLKQRLVNAALKELNITYVQFVILAGILELGEDGQVVTQQTIADRRRLDKAMVSNVVKTLLNKGYLIRRAHPDDRRAFTLELTPPGWEKALKGKTIARDIDTNFFAGIDQAEFRESLTKLLENDNLPYEK